MKRKFRSLWRWCLVLAVLVNAVAPVWAGAAMAANLLESVNQQAIAVEGELTRSQASGKAGCESDTQAPDGGMPSEHDGCDCGLTGTCNCPCTFSVKLIDIRVQFAARHLLAAEPVWVAWESADPGPRTSVFRPPIA